MDLLDIAKKIYQRLGGVIKSVNDLNSATANLSVATEVKSNSKFACAAYKSPYDFTVSYLSGNTLQITGGASVTDSTQIVYLKVIRTDNTSDIYINGNQVTMTYSGGVVTISDLDTPLNNTDVFELGINFQDKAYDEALDVEKITVQNPIWNRYTDAEILVTAQDLTASYADFGSEIDIRGYTHLGVFVEADVNDSEDVDMKVLGAYESGGDTYEIDGYSVKTLWSGAGTDFKNYYEFDIGALPFVTVQAIAGTVGTTAGNLTITLTKIWRP